MTNDASTPRSAYAWYVVLVLMGAYVLSFMDRQILNLLVQPIRRDLGISDTEMSLLMGLSFALFFTFFGIPLGRLADSGSRRGLIAAGVVLWSAMTGLCGLARGFWQLLGFRVGVGIGEAALSPAAYSLITDTFPAEKRSTAISVYSMGITLGSGLAMLIGGLVVQYASRQEVQLLPLVGAVRPWQVVFLVLGAAGVLYAFLLATVREPPRGRHAEPVPVAEVAGYVRANRATFTYHHLGFAMLALAGYGGAAWIPSFYVRRFDWSAAEVGMTFGLIQALAGTLGVLFGGRLADALARRGSRDANLRVGLVAAVGYLPFGALYPFLPVTAATALLVPAVFFTSIPWGVAPAAIQQVVPAAMRGQASALYLFVINLIGLGLGPTAVALATERLFQDDRAVHASLALVTVAANLLAAGLLWLGRKPFVRSLDSLEAAQQRRQESAAG